MLVINTGKELIKFFLFEDKKENRQNDETRQQFSTLFHLSEEFYLEGKLKLCTVASHPPTFCEKQQKVLFQFLISGLHGIYGTLNS